MGTHSPFFYTLAAAQGVLGLVCLVFLVVSWNQHMKAKIYVYTLFILSLVTRSVYSFVFAADNTQLSFLADRAFSDAGFHFASLGVGIILFQLVESVSAKSFVKRRAIPLSRMTMAYVALFVLPILALRADLLNGFASVSNPSGAVSSNTNDQIVYTAFLALSTLMPVAVGYALLRLYRISKTVSSAAPSGFFAPSSKHAAGGDDHVSHANSPVAKAAPLALLSPVSHLRHVAPDHEHSEGSGVAAASSKRVGAKYAVQGKRAEAPKNVPHRDQPDEASEALSPTHATASAAAPGVPSLGGYRSSHGTTPASRPRILSSKPSDAGRKRAITTMASDKDLADDGALRRSAGLSPATSTVPVMSKQDSHDSVRVDASSPPPSGRDAAAADGPQSPAKQKLAAATSAASVASGASEPERERDRERDRRGGPLRAASVDLTNAVPPLLPRRRPSMHDGDEKAAGGPAPAGQHPGPPRPMLSRRMSLYSRSSRFLTQQSLFQKYRSLVFLAALILLLWLYHAGLVVASFLLDLHATRHGHQVYLINFFALDFVTLTACAVIQGRIGVKAYVKERRIKTQNRLESLHPEHHQPLTARRPTLRLALAAAAEQDKENAAASPHKPAEMSTAGGQTSGNAAAPEGSASPKAAGPGPAHADEADTESHGVEPVKPKLARKTSTDAASASASGGSAAVSPALAKVLPQRKQLLSAPSAVHHRKAGGDDSPLRVPTLPTIEQEKEFSENKQLHILPETESTDVSVSSPPGGEYTRNFAAAVPRRRVSSGADAAAIAGLAAAASQQQQPQQQQLQPQPSISVIVSPAGARSAPLAPAAPAAQ